MIVLPSLRDNSPNVCLEALSLGKIIIARKDSGYNDLITNKYNGFLFSKNNDFEIIRLIKQVLKLSKKSKNKVIKNISIKNKLFKDSRVVNIYKQYLGKIT